MATVAIMMIAALARTLREMFFWVLISVSLFGRVVFGVWNKTFVEQCYRRFGGV
jgi:hypothetical protein